MFLFVQSWEVRKGKSQEYTDFVLRKHLPAMKEMGIHMIGGFHVIVGSGPRISAVSLATDVLDLQKVIQSNRFLSLTDELQNFVQDYGNRVLRSTGRIQFTDYSIEAGTWRFNQYYRIVRGLEKEYTDFLTGEYSTKLGELGLKIKAEWQVVLGSGPRVLLETVALNMGDIAQAFGSDDFLKLRRTMLINYVDNYSSRILAPTGRVEVAYILGGMTKAL